jgi:enoyl-CoA hydratase/carnithine racemase
MAQPTYDVITVEEQGPVALVTLNRPDRMNAWTWQMSTELQHAFAALDDRDEIRAIVVTGAGRAFCAGADLDPSGATFDGTRRRNEFDDRYPGPRKHAAQLRTPVIGAVNGAAVGAGLTMALEYDLRVVAEDAKLGAVFNRRGVIPDADLLWSLPRMIGYARAMDLLLTGRIFSGREAVELGLASRAVPKDQVLTTALEMGRDIATNVAPVSAAITKQLGRRFQTEMDQRAALRLESELFAWSGQQPDAKEGVVAFLEKRDPNWTLSKTHDVPEAARP